MSKKSSTQVKLYKKSEDPKFSPAARQYHLRRESGLCVKCGAPLAEGSKLLCQGHLDYYNTWHANKRAKIAKALELLKSSEQAPAPEVVETIKQEVVKTARKSGKLAKTTK